VGAGAGGTHVDNLMASVRLEWSPFVRGLEIGTNLAHDVLPVLNVYAKYNVVDTRWFGLGVRAGFRWIDFDNLWSLSAVSDSSSVKQALWNAEMFMVPLSVIASFPLADWVSIHTEVGYTYTPVSGDIVIDDKHFNSGIQWHELTINPTIHFYPGRGVALLFGVQVPVLSAVHGEGYTEDSQEALPGVRYGIQAALDTDFEVKNMVSPWFGVHIAWESFNLRVTGTWGLRFFDQSMFQAPGVLAYLPMPGFDAFWRF